MHLDVERAQLLESLNELRAQLAALEQEYNRFVPPDGETTLGRRTRVAHHTVLTKIAAVKSAIQQREKELGDT